MTGFVHKGSRIFHSLEKRQPFVKAVVHVIAFSKALTGITCLLSRQ